jgi:hypothetical protein
MAIFRAAKVACAAPKSRKTFVRMHAGFASAMAWLQRVWFDPPGRGIGQGLEPFESYRNQLMGARLGD